jgi:hypothetical protein
VTPEHPDGLDAAFDELDRALPPHWALGAIGSVETAQGTRWRAIALGRHGAMHTEHGATRADAVRALARWLAREFPRAARP